MIEVWPDNERPLSIFRRIGTRWKFPPMGMVPIGIEWPAIYPLMERMGLSDDDWNDLHDALIVMEGSALKTMQEFAPKPSQ